jgi:hypothetical protein
MSLFLVIGGVQLTAQTSGDVVVIDNVVPLALDSTAAPAASLDTQPSPPEITTDMVLGVFKAMSGGDEAVRIIQQAETAAAGARAQKTTCWPLMTFTYLTPLVPTWKPTGYCCPWGRLYLWNTDFTPECPLSQAHASDSVLFLEPSFTWFTPASAGNGEIGAVIFVSPSCLGWYLFVAQVVAISGNIQFQGWASTSMGATYGGTFTVGNVISLMPILVRVTSGGQVHVFYDQLSGNGLFLKFAVEYLGP